MFNRARTLEVLGYEFNPESRRRTKEEIATQPSVDKKSSLKVVDNCPMCGIERIIKYKQSKKNRPCSKCFHNLPHILEAKRNQDKNVSDQTRARMRKSHWSKSGTYSPRGQILSEEAKINVSKAIKKWNAEYRERVGEQEYRKQRSCSAQKIARDKFKGFVSPEAAKIRASKQYKDWEKKVKLKYGNKCAITGSSNITVHHLNAFAKYTEQRFNVRNGIPLDREIHNLFHCIHGRGDNTRAQFTKFLSKLKNQRPIVYLITGVAGSGKSWVCEQFPSAYVPYDKCTKNYHIYYIHKKYLETGGPVIYDRFTNISTFIKNFDNLFDIRLVVIDEEIEVLVDRLLSRGGKITNSWIKRVRRMKSLAKGAHFSGTSQEVLQFMHAELKVRENHV